MSSANFRWIHFSDLHVGHSMGRWLWPAFKTKFLDDISRQYDQSGPWDAVFFTGDLTQMGKREEFDELDRALDEIWARFNTLGTAPAIVTVPGNHDLARPTATLGEAVALRNFWGEPQLRNDLLERKLPDYDEFLANAFAEYSAWRERLVASGRHAQSFARGRMPGDASYRIKVGEQTIGVVGLNSTWLQLGGGDYRGKLAVDVRQLLAVTDNDPDSWCADNAANFLLTHHPTDWLHPESLKQWPSDIDVNQRFDLHLFGHMHEHNLTSQSQGGGSTRRSAQASALFGLEQYEGGKAERVQGYSLNRLVDENGKRKLTVWPRILTGQKDSDKQLTADTSMGLLDDKYFILSWEREQHEKDAAATAPIKLSSFTLASRPNEIAGELERIRYFVPDEPAHKNVRRVELHQAVSGLETNRVIWTFADWGMGEDGFLGTIQAQMQQAGAPTYRFDLSDYGNREQFLADTKGRFGVSFEVLCANIASGEPSYVLFNDIPVDLTPTPGLPPIERDVEELARILIEFASATKVILRATRQPKRDLGFPAIELKALDEADVALYLRDSKTSDALSTPDSVSAIFRHTDGVPNRIDVALRELAVTSLEDLISANTDFGDKALTVAVPPALIAAVAGVESAEDASERYAYELLKALASLPRGEQLKSIARLNGPIPFRASHALALSDRALIDSMPLTVLGPTHEPTTAKALVVPRPVREYVRDQLTDTETRSLDRRIIELYFGGNWKAGKIAASAAGRSARNSLCDMHEIVNASTLIVRHIKRAVGEGDDIEIEAGARLASAFVECLTSGHHHRAAAALCSDVIPLVPEEAYARQITVLNYEKAGCLRMTGRMEEARDLLLSLDITHLTKPQRQGMKLYLALIYDRLGEKEEAASAAKQCIALGRASAQALQAKSILAGQESDIERRMSALDEISLKSVRTKAYVVANNIGITTALLAMRNGDLENARTRLREVIACAARERDFYNGARAVANLAGMHPRGQPFELQDKIRLIDAYHYAHNERRAVLFDQCHDSLWNVFEAAGEIDNLLSLYRSSSFIWRINGRDAEDGKYLAKLRDLENRIVQRSLDWEYFVVRLIVVFGSADDDSVALS
jgi:predicted MPP superfamily phosphohydrolase